MILEANMWGIWLGALLVISGVLLLAAPPIWRGRLSERLLRATPPVWRARSSGKQARVAAQDTLEPREPGAGFELATSWPGLTLIVLGGVLLLASAVAF
jgi:hypothetical protein